MPRPAQRSGVITLTTDFGHKGPYTASMKGVMLSRFPEARLVDLTHESRVHWPAEAVTAEVQHIHDPKDALRTH